MAHFAKVSPEGIVVNVIVAEQEFIDSFIDDSPGQWIQTSYNTHNGIHIDPVTKEPSADQSKALRKNFAWIGGTYDAQRDAFIPPKRYASWILNEETGNWQAPVPKPTTPLEEGQLYAWNETDQQWILEG